MIYKKTKYFLIVFSLVGLFGCDDGLIPDIKTGKKDIAMSIGSQNAMYFGTSSLFFEKESGAGFYQHHSQCASAQWNDWFFVLEPMSSGKIFRYDMDDNNDLSGPLELSFGGGSGPSQITFLNNQKAFVSLSNLGKIAVINPTTMKKISEIDLADYAAGGDGSPEPTTSIIRGDYLYVALSQKVSIMAAHDTLGCVAIIDVNTDTLVKIISDSRVENLGSIDESNSTVFMDDNDNIYFYSNAVWGYQDGIQEGFLRINNGETEFDQSYSFNLTSASLSDIPGDAISYGLSFRYAGSGIVYSSLLVPALTSNPPDYMNDRNYQSVKIDLINKTITKLTVSPTDGRNAKAIMMENNGTILMGQNSLGSKPSGLYRYYPKGDSLSNDPVLEIDGSIYFLYELED